MAIHVIAMVSTKLAPLKTISALALLTKRSGSGCSASGAIRTTPPLPMITAYQGIWRHATVIPITKHVIAIALIEEQIVTLRLKPGIGPKQMTKMPLRKH